MMNRRRKSKKNGKIILMALIFGVLLGSGISAWTLTAGNKEKEQGAGKLAGTDQTAEKSEKTVPEKPAVLGGKKEEKVKPAAQATFNQKDMEIEEKVDALVKRMTLQEKVGQMMVVGFGTKAPDAHIKKMIEEYKAGGVIYYDRNMETRAQVGKLTQDLQAMAVRSRLQIPLMVSVDQEGGSIVRMKEQVSPIPSQQALGGENKARKVYSIAARTGKELLGMGINVNYAPVLDLSDTDTRSFGSDPAKTGEFGAQVVKGLISSGMAATLKHFPGNGRSNIDPHVETSSVHADKVDLESKDIFPFTKIIKEMDNDKFFVMVTHIKYPAYDKVNPASTSPVIIDGLLRRQLGYKGIVVTDDLEMGAVSKYIDYKDLGVKAIQAGADLLLVCHTLQYQEEVFHGIISAVKAGHIAEDRIDEAVARILRFKLKNPQIMQIQ
ncbi:glycoside hydrolase family 3 protein [Peribacillus sp. SCS-37]|uniref:glycoside hydrolase family 3 protein n=1 Tax=Paraperibacillus esterisolvens TaxID=3115296 RepID=UPI003905F4E3